MKLAVAGTGYVGLSLAVLLAQHNEVVAVDVLPERVALVNDRKSTIQDEYIEQYLAEKQLHLSATLDAEAAYRDAEFVIIAAPTNYDSEKNFFDTSRGRVGHPARHAGQPGRHHGHQDPRFRSASPKAIREKYGLQKHPVQPGIPARERRRCTTTSTRAASSSARRYAVTSELVKAAHTFAEAAARGCASKQNIDTLYHGFYRGRSGQTVRQYLSRPARQLFQRAGYLRRDEGPRHRRQIIRRSVCLDPRIGTHLQ